MKVIGLLGGTSWPSTISYYQSLNKLVNEALGGFRCAKILLYNIDYHDIKTSYANNWQNVVNLLEKEICFLLEKKPDCLVICNNTLHKAFDEIKDRLNLQVPIFHAGHLCVKKAVSLNCKSILLLGTKFTMEDGFFAKYFTNQGIDIIIPSFEERVKIQEIQTQISTGVSNDDFYNDFKNIITNYLSSAEAVCLACTELPLYINKANCPLPIINPINLQCIEAVNFAIN